MAVPAATTRLTKQAADQVAGAVAARMAGAGLLPTETAAFPAETFHQFRAKVQEAFYVPETSITPVMARVLFMLAASARPHRILVLGSHAGNAMVWLAGPGIAGLYTPEGVWGVDIDPAAVRLARTNFMALHAPHYVAQVCCDAHDVPETIGGSFDLVYIDTENGGKRIYHTILERIYPALTHGALLLAHDVIVDRFREDLAPYLSVVRDKRFFRRSATLAIDYCGLEVSLK